ncbi:hypothetical protein R4575_16730 [Acinetobacter baumannii]|nr:hypothetical protein [Acinetobacter baumannii]
MFIDFNETERREFDLRYTLLVNIQYEIGLYQSFLLNKYTKESKPKLIEDYKSLSSLQSKLSSQSTDTLRKIYHDITIKLGEILNA